jgi:calcium-dependent protein kinase
MGIAETTLQESLASPSKANVGTTLKLSSTARTTSFACSYRLLGDRALGSGGFGEVWRCRAYGAASEHTDKAVKRIKTSCLSSAGRQQVFNEVKIQCRLDHPHIVALHGVFCDFKLKPSETISLVIELCPGGDLFERVAKIHAQTGKGVPEGDACAAFQHILRALEFLHEQRIVHRDVRCENVLLAQSDVPLRETTFKICDFGIAAVVPEDGMLRECVGLPASTAPEVLSGEPYSTPADLWSAGVLLFGLLVATSPFASKSQRKVVDNVRHGKFSLQTDEWQGISDDAKQFVCRLLELSVEKRVSATSALRDPWIAKQAAPSSCCEEEELQVKVGFAENTLSGQPSEVVSARVTTEPIQHLVFLPNRSTRRMTNVDSCGSLSDRRSLPSVSSYGSFSGMPSYRGAEDAADTLSKPAPPKKSMFACLFSCYEGLFD